MLKYGLLNFQTTFSQYSHRNIISSGVIRWLVNPLEKPAGFFFYLGESSTYQLSSWWLRIRKLVNNQVKINRYFVLKLEKPQDILDIVTVFSNKKEPMALISLFSRIRENHSKTTSLVNNSFYSQLSTELYASRIPHSLQDSRRCT